jgi:hypothetical protein
MVRSFMPDVQCNPNVIYGPVIPAHRWKGRPDNVVRNGWSFEVYTRLDGIVSSFVPRVHRSARAAARARRELINLSRSDAVAHRIDPTVHDCRSDEALLATIQRLWG